MKTWKPSINLSNIQLQTDTNTMRCKWNNLESSPLYTEYHDKEWGVASHDDKYLFEMLVLESFHCGLSWLLVLTKRDNFRKAFDNFDAKKIIQYDDKKIVELMQNNGIIRNKRKILATIKNAKSFLEVQKEFGSFSNYIWAFTNSTTLHFPFDGIRTHNELSDTIAKDLKKRGFSFMGTVTTFSYLEAIGVMNNHAEYCLCSNKKNK